MILGQVCRFHGQKLTFFSPPPHVFCFFPIRFRSFLFTLPPAPLFPNDPTYTFLSKTFYFTVYYITKASRKNKKKKITRVIIGGVANSQRMKGEKKLARIKKQKKNIKENSLIHSYTNLFHVFLTGFFSQFNQSVSQSVTKRPTAVIKKNLFNSIFLNKNTCIIRHIYGCPFVESQLYDARNFAAKLFEWKATIETSHDLISR